LALASFVSQFAKHKDASAKLLAPPPYFLFI
jgi:hypothetical protein